MAKFNVTFNGSNASGYVRYGDNTFPCGKTVRGVELDAEWEARLSNHPEFTVSEAGSKAAATAG